MSHMNHDARRPAANRPWRVSRVGPRPRARADRDRRTAPGYTGGAKQARPGGPDNGLRAACCPLRNPAMEKSTYPFPLAAHSSHHSHYHRFLLGADPSILAPFPKPCCTGSLSGPVCRLAGNLDLQRWRKLFHGTFPWVDGFGPEHYEIGSVAPHRPLPRAYGRPLRRFGAFDFVQSADPSLSALALVAGDRRAFAQSGTQRHPPDWAHAHGPVRGAQQPMAHAVSACSRAGAQPYVL